MFSFERVAAILASFFVADYALSFVSLFVLRRRMPESAAAVSGLGLSVDHGAGARGIDPVSGGSPCDRCENTPLTFHCARGKLSGISRAEVGVAHGLCTRIAALEEPTESFSFISVRHGGIKHSARVGSLSGPR